MTETERELARRRSLLATISNLQCRLHDLQQQQRYLIKAAVIEGCSWRQIGAAVGTSGQAAWERYKQTDPGKVKDEKG